MMAGMRSRTTIDGTGRQPAGARERPPPRSPDRPAGEGHADAADDRGLAIPAVWGPAAGKRRSGHLGKRVGRALYVHVSAVESLPAADRERVQRAAALVAGGWNVAKIVGTGLSLLRYEPFEDAAFPRLLDGWCVIGDRVRYTSYGERRNPPILHRKELLLAPGDPRREAYAALTRAAENAGLFRDVRRIGTARAWADRLEVAGLAVHGARLVARD